MGGQATQLGIENTEAQRPRREMDCQETMCVLTRIELAFETLIETHPLSDGYIAVGHEAACRPRGDESRFRDGDISIRNGRHFSPPAPAGIIEKCRFRRTTVGRLSAVQSP